MGGCSGRILTFAYAEAFRFSVALEPPVLRLVECVGAVQPETPSRRGSAPAGANPAAVVLLSLRRGAETRGEAARGQVEGWL